VSLLFPDAAQTPPPIVILDRVTGDTSGIWQNLHAESRVALADLQNEGLIYPVVADRAVKWPNPRLRNYDLGGRPTIVVTPEVGADRLHIWVGGCDLLPPGGADVLQSIPMLKLEFRREAELKRFAFTRGYDDRAQDLTLVPVRRLNEGDINTFESNREYVKLGAAAVHLLVARLADHYHLATRYGYAPRFEQVIASFEARAEGVADSAVGQRTEVPAIPEQVIADLPFYRLARAARTTRGAAPGAVLGAVVHSLAAFGGYQYPSDPTAVARLLRDHRPTSPRKTTAAVEARKILEGLPETTPGRADLLDAVAGLLSRVEAATEMAVGTRRPELKAGPPLSFWIDVFRRAYASADVTPTAVGVVKWASLVAWFRSNESLIHADPDNIAVMVKEAQKDGRTGVVTGIYNRRSQRVLTAEWILASSLDEQTRQMFGPNDACIVS
jgi:hypothetical protein